MTRVQQTLRAWTNERILAALCAEDDPYLKDQMRRELARRQAP